MTFPRHDVSHLFPLPPGAQRPITNKIDIPLPTQGRPEREHLYLWIIGEESYVAGKFDDQRAGHDDSLRAEGMSRDGFWPRQITQYIDRARIAFEGAQELRESAVRIQSMTDPEAHIRKRALERSARLLEMKGQQALAKCMMTAKGCVESSIRVFGPMPKPGLSSGNVEDWL